ncbi:MAG: hypothetical protein OHK93_004493 [Ramalina farinacea]|uniref:Uncharacterized protein n=1 Tax=Ramalina farinacea TaxID=258253 RepID=A0AA43QU67_9LECA|nr:hypothetical protein [Ramalina farinacea]
MERPMRTYRSHNFGQTGIKYQAQSGLSDPQVLPHWMTVQPMSFAQAERTLICACTFQEASTRTIREHMEMIRIDARFEIMGLLAYAKRKTLESCCEWWENSSRAVNFGVGVSIIHIIYDDIPANYHEGIKRVKGQLCLVIDCPLSSFQVKDLQRYGPLFERNMPTELRIDLNVILWMRGRDDADAFGEMVDETQGWLRQAPQESPRLAVELYLKSRQSIANEDELGDDMLTADDWKTLTSIRDFLSVFYEVTKSTENNVATAELVLSAMDFMLDHFDNSIDQYTDNAFMIASLDVGYSKLLKYFNKHARTPAYVAAITLNPSIKWTLFKKLWKPEEVERASKAPTTMWREDYSHFTSLPILTVANPEDTDDQISFHRRLKATKADIDISRDELDRC